MNNSVSDHSFYIESEDDDEEKVYNKRKPMGTIRILQPKSSRRSNPVLTTPHGPRVTDEIKLVSAL
ncbi:hypothetical protein L1049_011980 [Liquidambar formosana]|uniref:Uncharacterized protein n=1 Tax=Liquidambar formosana TaxID=63359 RepID=A0AAP0RZ50_LIQFO